MKYWPKICQNLSFMVDIFVFSLESIRLREKSQRIDTQQRVEIPKNPVSFLFG